MNRSLALAALCLVVAAPAAAQRNKRKEDKWRIDPYTKLEPKALDKAGYLSAGPFPWGDDHDSSAIETKLGDVPLLWVETPHFRIGSSLATWQLERKDKKRTKKLRDELARLEKKLPRLKAKRVKRLDPWLRLHLFAQRLEGLYADIAGRFEKAGVPLKAPAQSASAGGTWDGSGMPPKFLVLLFQQHTSLERYQSVFLAMNTKFPRRFIFAKNGCPLFVTASTVYPGNLRNDGALHCHVVFNVVHNFVDGYKGNYYQLPVWFGEGLAHWYGRRIDPEFSNYSQPPNETAEMRKHEKWQHIVRNLVKHDNFTPFEEMIRWQSYPKIRLKDHFVAWSRVDFLMDRDENGLGVFLDRLKGQRDARGATIRGPAVHEAHEKALEKAWKLAPAAFDEAWKAWVDAEYRR